MMGLISYSQVIEPSRCFPKKPRLQSQLPVFGLQTPWLKHLLIQGVSGHKTVRVKLKCGVIIRYTMHQTGSQLLTIDAVGHSESQSALRILFSSVKLSQLPSKRIKLCVPRSPLLLLSDDLLLPHNTFLQ